MSKGTTPPARKEIRNLLGVLIGSVLCALVFGGMLLHYYGPGGRYLAKNVLLSPHIAPGLSYTDRDLKTGVKGRFSFDSIDFSYYDNSTKKWLHIPVTPSNYDAFYALVSDEKSLSEVGENIKELFEKTPSSTLSLKVHSDSETHAPAKSFQDIHFVSEGDYYRVELREEGAQDTWAYFYHPGIYQEVLQLFTSTHK